MSSKILTAPPDSGEAITGKTLTQVLFEACARYQNDRAFNHPRGDDWEVWSLQRFRDESEEIGLGLLQAGLEPGDRVAMFMESDVFFCLADMACLMVRLVDVPIYLTHKDDQIRFVLEHSEAKAVFVSDDEKLARIAPVLSGLSSVKTIIVAESEGAQPELPEGIHLSTLAEVRDAGRARRNDRPDELPNILKSIKPDHLATIIYTSGTTGMPKGVMLSHENISYNALTSFSGLSDYKKGPDGEVGLSFLPLTHIFARTLHYGFVGSGSTVYFTTPDDLSRDLKRVRPTVFASVPRLLEKVYGRILERVNEMSGVKRRLLTWSLELAKQYEIGKRPGIVWRAKHRVADRLVFSKWREALGGRSKYIIAGGAALNARLANVFAAAGVTVLQGYGLTETSPVITYNRPQLNRAGTVGVPIPGVEVKISDDGEILTRGPHIMKGYFRDDERTAEVIDREGWLHTGDIGEITPEGYLKITDRKKDLFKLSTGKYVTPQPLESQLTSDPLIEQAIVLGLGHKFCTALIFPDQDSLRTFARSHNLDDDAPIDELVANPEVRAKYQELVDQANSTVDHTSEIKRFALVPDHLSAESGLLTPTMKVRRSALREKFSSHIDALYSETPDDAKRAGDAVIVD